MEKPYLSVIIPAYKEGERIGQTLLEIEEYFKKQNYSYEILIVVDGSPDNTAEIASNYALQVDNVRVIENKQNRGKGAVVKQGLLEACGQYRLFMDADGSTSITHLDTFLPEFEHGYGLVIGSRDIKGAFIQIHQSRYREFMGNGGNWLIRIVLGLWSFADTQCGFKILTEEAAQAIGERMRVNRFGFDFEIIALAFALGFTVKQMPVRWLNEEGSTVSLTGPNGYIQVIIDLFKTRYRLLIGQYRVREYRKQLAENS